MSRVTQLTFCLTGNQGDVGVACTGGELLMGHIRILGAPEADNGNDVYKKGQGQPLQHDEW